MKKRELVAWIGVVLATASFGLSLHLNHLAKLDLDATEARERRSWRLVSQLGVRNSLCADAFLRARDRLDDQPGQSRTEQMLVAAWGAQLCLDKDAASALRQKAIVVETSAECPPVNSDEVKELGLELMRRLAETSEYLGRLAEEHRRRKSSRRE